MLRNNQLFYQLQVINSCSASFVIDRCSASFLVASCSASFIISSYSTWFMKVSSLASSIIISCSASP